MSFREHSLIDGVFSPTELSMIQRVFNHIVDEGLIPAAQTGREKFGRYVLTIYRRGMCDEHRLAAFCRVAARHRYPLIPRPEKEPGQFA